MIRFNNNNIAIKYKIATKSCISMFYQYNQITSGHNTIELLVTKLTKSIAQ